MEKITYAHYLMTKWIINKAPGSIYEAFKMDNTDTANQVNIMIEIVKNEDLGFLAFKHHVEKKMPGVGSYLLEIYDRLREIFLHSPITFRALYYKKGIKDDPNQTLLLH